MPDVSSYSSCVSPATTTAVPRASVEERLRKALFTLELIAGDKPSLMQTDSGHEVLVYPSSINPMKLARDCLKEIS